MSENNKTFQVAWVGQDHIKIVFKPDMQEFIFNIKEYTDFMQLMHEFNIHFREKIDQKLVEWYYNE